MLAKRVLCWTQVHQQMPEWPQPASLGPRSPVPAQPWVGGACLQLCLPPRLLAGPWPLSSLSLGQIPLMHVVAHQPYLNWAINFFSYRHFFIQKHLKSSMPSAVRLFFHSPPAPHDAFVLAWATKNKRGRKTGKCGPVQAPYAEIVSTTA